MSRYLQHSMILRLTLTLAAIALLVSSVAGAMLFWALARKVEQQDMSEVAGKLELVSYLVDTMGDPANISHLKTTLDNMLVGHANMRVWISDAQQNTVYGSAPPVNVSRISPTKVALVTSDNVEMHGQSVPANPKFFQGGSVTVAIDTRPAGRFLSGYGTALIAICILWVGLTGLLSAWAVRRTLAPVRRLSEEAARIRPENLTLRLSADGMDVELRELAESFNRMLDRLQATYEQMEAFNANVAHELRTPLTTMISGAQIVLSSPRPAKELKEALASNLEDLDELKTLVNDMLFLARADAGERATDLSVFSLRTEVEKVTEFYEASLEQSGLALVMQDDCNIFANQGLVRRALANLVGNAVKVTPRGGTIRLECSRSAEAVHIAVRNPGRPIAASELPFIFDRFYRGGGDYDARSDGYGLGLAIVLAIARMHGGRAYAASSQEETMVAFSIANGGKITER